MSQWSNSWSEAPADPRDRLDKDQVLLLWQEAKNKLEVAKELELELRKYVVKRAFPEPTEGTNKQELGNGYELKANIKFNYNLDTDNKKVWNALDRISKIGNEGSFIAERLVSWKANFLVTEYRKLQEADDPSSKEILKIVQEVLTITDAAPSLVISEPKKEKKK